MRCPLAPAFPVVASAFMLLLAPGGPPAAVAVPLVINADEPSRAIEYAGDGGNLPIGPTVTCAQAIQAALRLPLTAEAMSQFESRGYLRRAASDTAVFTFADPPTTFVVLAYNKPGFTPGSNHVGAPLILVASSLTPGGEPITACTAGIFVVDTLNHVAFSGDSLPALAASDPSFDVVGASGGEAGDPMRRPVIRLHGSETPWTTFTRFIKCSSLVGTLCFFYAVLRIELNPFGMFMTSTNPEILAATLIACMGYAAVSCAWSQFFLQ